MPILKAGYDLMHDTVLTYLRDQKAKNKGYRVLDVGGTAMPWAHEISPDYLDIQPHATISGDACLSETWNRVGQYDFSICTQTLEDLRDPLFVIRKLFKHSKSGFIGVPHKHRELGMIEFGNVVGYCHHRWVFTIQQEKLRILAKWPVVAQLAPGSSPGPNFLTWLNWGLVWKGELDFTWEKDFPVEYVRGDFPGLAHEGCHGMLMMYRDELAEGL